MFNPPNGSRESQLGKERFADELWLKLQIRLFPRIVGKYVKRLPGPAGSKDQRWSTFLRNHAHQMVACDFFVSFTACLRLFYVFVALESGWARLSGLFALHTSLMLISFHSSRLG
jgi:putative transposase